MKVAPVVLASSLLVALVTREASALGPTMVKGEAARAAVTRAREVVQGHPGRGPLELVDRAVLATGESTVVRFEQRHHGLPVLGSSVAVRLGPQGEVRQVMGEAAELTVDEHPTLAALWLDRMGPAEP